MLNLCCTVNIDVHYLCHFLTEYLMVADHMRANIYHIRPSSLRSACMRWQGTSRCTISERPTNAKLICGSKCLHLFSWHRSRRRLQPLFRMGVVSSWWLTPVSPQHLCTAVQKPPHLPAWCMHMCQTIHSPSIANPSGRECYYAVCQSNAAGEQMCAPCVHVFMDMKGREEWYIPLRRWGDAWVFCMFLDPFWCHAHA